MMRRLAKSFPIILVAAFAVQGFLIAPNDAYAGLTGCSRQPLPGDAYDCTLGGPYGPGTLGQGNNCTSACKTLVKCLNSATPTPPCANQHNNLNVCIRNARSAMIDWSQNEGCYASITPNGDGTKVGHAVSWDNSSSDDSSGGYYDEPICVDAGDGSPAVLLQEIVGDVLNVDPSEVRADSDLYADFGATWEDMRVIADRLEYSFGFDITDNVVNEMSSISDLIVCSEEAWASV